MTWMKQRNLSITYCNLRFAEAKKLPKQQTYGYYVRKRRFVVRLVWKWDSGFTDCSQFRDRLFEVDEELEDEIRGKRLVAL